MEGPLARPSAPRSSRPRSRVGRRRKHPQRRRRPAQPQIHRHRYTRLPDTLDALGPPLQGKASAQTAAFIDAELASGRKNGYTFRYVLKSNSTSGAQARYELAATPIQYGRGGIRSFFRDADGKFHAADHQGAVGSPSDPPVD